MHFAHSRLTAAWGVACIITAQASLSSAEQSVAGDLDRIDTKRGVVAVLDLPGGGAEHVVALAAQSELTLYFQSKDSGQVDAVRKAAAKAGLLGQRVFADRGALGIIHLADNVADCILVGETAKAQVPKSELLRALRPDAIAYVGDQKIVKPEPKGYDHWTHPYHGPDNNPQSADEFVRGAFRTQFLADPKFSPMPEQTVAGGGRIFKAMGHIAHKANQNAMLNTLLCINAYNGTILWKRPLSPGFMIHRNTMIATDDALYMGDHESCKVIDAKTGKVRDEIKVPKGLTDGPVWKWMAMRDGVLYALVGNPEVKVSTKPSTRGGLGHWPWGMWEGHDYKDPRTAFGFGRTLVAIDIKSKDILWSYRDEEFLDARAICMNSKNLYLFSAEHFLACVEVESGKLLWKNKDDDLLKAIGPNQKAQHYVTGYATTCYMKCTEDHLFFAGPQRKQMVVATARDGKLAWTHPDGNLQLVLRKDGIYAAGPKATGVRLDYESGKKLGALPTRRACTRATGCVDSVFYRTSGGTVRVLTETHGAEHIAALRPPCQDGVIVSNGHLYWGPWMCGCQLSLYGNISLAPAKAIRENGAATALQTAAGYREVASLGAKAGDWPSYRGGNDRKDTTTVAVPDGVQLQWKAKICNGALPTAPVVVGGFVFIADRTGAVQCLDPNGKQVWKSYTAGPVYYPPAVSKDRVFVGSADGRVYAFEATTGRFLWSYRVAPEERWIPAYGRLVSTWPVAGGVVVHEGLVYAAAGIANYDGTYVAALDAVSGELRASSDSSGSLASEVNGGVSMQGNLRIVNNELQFLGGGVYEVARYQLKTLNCLNSPKVQLNSQFRTAFYPLYPTYGKFVSLEHSREDGSTIYHDASYEGSKFTNLTLAPPLAPGQKRISKEEARWAVRRGKNPPKDIWSDKQNRRFTSFIVGAERIITSGHSEKTPKEKFLTAINMADGADVWTQSLPSEAVKGGTAIDSEGRIYVALEDGQLLCYQP